MAVHDGSEMGGLRVRDAASRMRLEHTPLALVDLRVRVGEHDHAARRRVATEHTVEGRGAQGAVPKQPADVQVLWVGETANCAHDKSRH